MCVLSQPTLQSCRFTVCHLVNTHSCLDSRSCRCHVIFTMQKFSYAVQGSLVTGVVAGLRAEVQPVFGASLAPSYSHSHCPSNLLPSVLVCFCHLDFTYCAAHRCESLCSISANCVLLAVSAPPVGGRSFAKRSHCIVLVVNICCQCPTRHALLAHRCPCGQYL